jgi:hypothetical protein
MGRHDDGDGPSDGPSRRTFLGYVAALSFGTSAGLRPGVALGQQLPLNPTWPKYILRRPRDELFLKLTAIGYREAHASGSRWLAPLANVKDRYFVFEFPPQHFAEIAIATDKVIPLVFDESKLAGIRLTPSDPSEVVFRIKSRHRIPLRLDTLLAWHEYELVLPDLAKVGADYDLEIPRTHSPPSTRIEIPWGIELSPPADTVPSSFAFDDAVKIRSTGSWTELWTTSLKRKGAQVPKSISLEVLSIRGFDKKSLEGTVADGTVVVTYGDRPGLTFPPRPTPLSNYSRIDIGTSLSRRFPYTGKITPLIDTGVVKYQSDDPFQSGCIAACFAPGRSISASQMRLSSRGGWLQLEGKWDPFPGCALSGWVHSASLGRDHHVKVISEGFLYPFGTPCELVLLSERVFGQDKNGHFVAPLIEQIFLQIPQPNSIAVGHVESPFTALSVTTPRSPPLDLPPGGDPETYRHYDFFLPMVGGVPFAFEHVGTDWDGNRHGASMPMFFVNNKARAPNGLIWEPGSQWTPTHQNLVCPTTPLTQGDTQHAIDPNADGLRIVDKYWALEPGRFAQYGGASIALAASRAKGRTAQRIEWIEWTRGNIPDLLPKVISLPFRPRARTMRARIQSMDQISGEPSNSLISYRDVRFTYSAILDPEPTTPPSDYFFNVSAQSNDPETPYVFMLDTRALVAEPGSVSQRSAAQVAKDIREAYFGVSQNPSPIPDSLFGGIDNEVRFGRSSSAEGIGGLSVPDTHLSLLNRQHGPVGDATFNDRRWPGYTGPLQTRIQASHRLDYTAFARQSRPQHDVQPFDSSRTQADRDTIATAARTLMGTTAPLMAFAARDTSSVTPGLKLGDLFGIDAQVIPGLSFKDIFQDVALGLSSDRPSGERAAAPLVWKVRTSGIEWLSDILNGLVPASIPDLIATLSENALTALPGEQPLSLGVEASLQWSNDVFKPVTVGPAQFIPTDGKTQITINAKARIDLGKVVIPTDGKGFSFSPGKPRVSARAEMVDFDVIIFSAMKISFSNLSFEIFEDGHKNFVVQIAKVDLLPPLDFISQLAKIFGGLGDDSVHIVPTPQQIKIWQTLQFPAEGSGPLFIGPAQVSNLALGWSVTIPLAGRDVLAVGFSVSSREKPLTIYVPPWYGGKAYALLELTTKGCRLVEISMEYGALVPITWGIATGQASLTAGIFYMLERKDTAKSAEVILRAFVKAAADLSVAGIIQFAGLIYIAMSRITSSTQKIVQGVATVSVSIKIGFVRISYSFSAVHEEVSNDSQGFVANAVAAQVTFAAGVPRVAGTYSSIGSNAPASDGKPFGPSFKRDRRLAFERVLSGYR